MNSREQKIIEYIFRHGKARSSHIYSDFVAKGETITLVTIKRDLARMTGGGILYVSGKGRATAYSLTEYGKLTANIDPASYCSQEPDLRFGADKYNFEILSALNFNPFSKPEVDNLNSATEFYNSRIKDVSEALHKKELERFIIELSWKSSKIEGNTYTLLDTELLIKEGLEAQGHPKEEATMILNHKDAFKFIYSNQKDFKSLTRANLENVHKMLMRGFNVGVNLRTKPIGITGSKYQPLDNQYQIAEAVDQLSLTISRMPNGYAKAMIALLGISYIQPFEDGNKRTARLIANGILLTNHLTPLSYRSVDEKQYLEAMLVFYELNSLAPFKRIFIDQYNFAARNYLAG